MPDQVVRVKQFVQIKRGGTAIEVTHAAILWLLSDEASYTTCCFIDLMGGSQ